MNVTSIALMICRKKLLPYPMGRDVGETRAESLKQCNPLAMPARVPSRLQALLMRHPDVIIRNSVAWPVKPVCPMPKKHISMFASRWIESALLQRRPVLGTSSYRRRPIAGYLKCTLAARVLDEVLGEL